MSIKESRSLSFVILTVVYALAFVVGLLVYRALDGTGWHYLWPLFIADAAATVVVWLFGLVFRNVSVYDPYWSVAPPVMLSLWACHLHSWTSATVLLLIAVWYWGIRLTGNWAFTFKNLNSEDWRYAKYRKEQHPVIFQLINFFGLTMMPTVIVFLVMIPGFFVIEAPFQANAVCWLGFAICLAAATLQLVADTQRHRFAEAHRGQICEVGLWKHGRHPNYFGEILMWWGVWVMYLALWIETGTGCSLSDFCVAGALLNTGLFCFISVPLMEKRQLQNKPGYAEYQKRTRMFL
jgi:steroid 5-alpha reductase family enzyme